MIFFDNASTTRVLDEVALYINEVSKNYYGNPSSIHSKGRDAKKKIIEVKEKIALCLSNEKKKISADEIFFCSSATEANNIAINSVNKNSNYLNGKIALYDELAHPSITETIKGLEKYLNNSCENKEPFLAKKVKNKNGFLDTKIDEKYFYGFKNEIKIPNLISLNEINSETGAINDVASFVENFIKFTKSNLGSLNIKPPIIHIDGTQGFLKKDMFIKNDITREYQSQLQTLNFNDIDFYTFSSHKVNGPKGLGIFYFNGGKERFKKLGLNTLLKGGSQEGGLRSATESTELILGFGRLIDTHLSGKLCYELNIDDINYLKTYVDSKLKGYKFVQEMFKSEGNTPLILNLITPYPSEVFVNMLSDKSVYISEGFACSSKNKDISKTLLSCGLTKDEAKRTVRISFGIYNKRKEIDDFINIIKAI